MIEFLKGSGMEPVDYFISDTHFFHARIIEFGRPFKDINHHNQVIAENWNKTVLPHDRVWVLGDCVFGGKENLVIFERLNGKKFLVLGNHDGGNKELYLKQFAKIEGAMEIRTATGTILFTHYPVHPMNLESGRYKLNVHGHTHGHVVMNGNVPDHRYVCVSLEQINYTPVNLKWILNKANSMKPA